MKKGQGLKRAKAGGVSYNDNAFDRLKDLEVDSFDRGSESLGSTRGGKTGNYWN